MTVPDLRPTDLVLTTVLGMRHVREYKLDQISGPSVHVYEMGDGGPAAELHVEVEPGIPPAHAEGVQAQQSGYPCHCISCHSFTPAMREKEVQRIRYACRRREDLKAEGVEAEAAEKIIDDEIGRGAVQQQQAATVIRSTKAAS